MIPLPGKCGYFLASTAVAGQQYLRIGLLSCTPSPPWHSLLSLLVLPSGGGLEEVSRFVSAFLGNFCSLVEIFFLAEVSRDLGFLCEA